MLIFDLIINSSMKVLPKDLNQSLEANRICISYCHNIVSTAKAEYISHSPLLIEESKEREEKWYWKLKLK